MNSFLLPSEIELMKRTLVHITTLIKIIIGIGRAGFCRLHIWREET